MSIGKFCVAKILENPSIKNDDLLKMVLEEFPSAKTTYACIAWYKSDLRKKGKLAKRNEPAPKVLTEQEFKDTLGIV